MSQTITPADPPRESLDLEHDTFDGFYLRIYNKLVARAVVVGCPRADVEEVVQDVLIKIWERWSTISWTTRSRYTFRVLHHETITRHRRARATQQIGSTFDISLENWTDDTDVEQTVVSKDEASQALHHIKALSPHARHVILMIADGYTQQEVANTLDIDASTVRTHLFRARKAMQKLLDGRS